ncbi:MAG TPA: hypothetical protein VLH84_02215 [Patescibacteria group bacterium]|nr:hypothetical protein [Patescibacteria group bacterium]
MAYDNPEAFGKFHLYKSTGPDSREIGKYGREVLTLVEARGIEDDLLATYQRLLGVLGTHGTEAARARVIHGWGQAARTVLAEHVFLLPWKDHQDTVLTSMAGDNEERRTDDGEYVRYDRKSSMQQLGPMGEVALQYDGLAEPPVLRVIDVQGGDRQGTPQSDLPVEFLPALRAGVAT